MRMARRDRIKIQSVEDIQHILRQHIPALSEKYGIQSLELFGSYVRGEQKRGSDIDILVEFHPNRSLTLFTFVRLEQELSDLLGMKVDLVEKGSLKPGLRNRIIQEAVPI
ncbi:MAG: nucleotidyltransferase family protein [Methanolinea sp.]|jgi:hypothetical protein|nr:nucleotidyltransferase family protein [Methanolinea sp.]